ncbi:MAG: hypothetical protein U0414_27215 [Polyangiaceae bacterium]
MPSTLARSVPARDLKQRWRMLDDDSADVLAHRASDGRSRRSRSRRSSNSSDKAVNVGISA